MAQVMDTVGGLVAGILGSPPVVIGSRAILLYLAVLWVASAWWVYRDLHRRTRDPITPYAAAAAVVLFTPLFFPLAVAAYRIIRPPETTAERRERDLEQRLIVDSATTEACPSCSRAVEADWIKCPTCRSTIGSTCPVCGRRVELDWTVCAWCAADLVERAAPVAIREPRKTAPKKPRSERSREPSPRPQTSKRQGRPGVPPVIAAD